MSIFQAFVLGIAQGITEFLPISSSGHLILIEDLFGLHVSELKGFDVAVHMGTLCAILVYFCQDFVFMLWSRPGVKNLQVRNFTSGRDEGNGRKLLFYVIIGTIPAVLAGVFLEDFLDTVFRGSMTVAIMMIAVGVVFFAGEFVNKKLGGTSGKMKWWKALIIGVAQAIALIPGVSRSGSTIVTGLFQGISRENAARFSFLLGAPAIFGAGLLTALKGGLDDAGIIVTLIGFLSSAVFGFLTISFLMRFLKKHSLGWFGVYRILVGLIILF